MRENPYNKARMSNWFQPPMLLNIALKLVISGAFGNYADPGELQAALESTFQTYSGKINIIIDDPWLQLHSPF